MPKRPMGDVIVLLPGILGSVLQHNGKDVWAIDGGAVWKGIFSLGHSVTDLEIKGVDDLRPDLGDGVTAPRLMPDVHMIPGLWKIDGYSHIHNAVASEFDIRDGHNWHDFPYDWRRDNRVHAERLASLAPGWLDAWRKESGNPNAKLILLGHSMGGLVSRHFLEVLGGWQHTRMLVTFGTPYRGSVNAVDFLCNGMRKGIGPFGIDLTNMLRSFTSVYQLLPRYPVIDPGTSVMQRVVDTPGLPGVDQARAAAALTFLTDIDEGVAKRDPKLPIHPIVGIGQPTSVAALFTNGKVSTLQIYPGDDHGGDGTVPRPSATPLELADTGAEVYASDQHGSLQNGEGPLTQLIGLLSARPTSGYRGGLKGFGLQVDDVFMDGEPVKFTVSADRPPSAVRARIADIATGKPVSDMTINANSDGVFHGQADIAVGSYRLQVTTADGADNERTPVNGLFLVGSSIADPG